MEKETGAQGQRTTLTENDITLNNISNEALIERVELLNTLMDNNPSLIF